MCVEGEIDAGFSPGIQFPTLSISMKEAGSQIQIRKATGKRSNSKTQKQSNALKENGVKYHIKVFYSLLFLLITKCF
jgi:hypothetical protein